MSKIRLIICAFFVITGCVRAADNLMLADFDTGAKPNKVGGNFGAWDKDPEDFTQCCWEEFNTNETRQGEGYCMSLEYDVDSPNAAYNGFWMKMGGLDASAYDNLVLWIKSDEKKGGASRFKIELKTESERGAQYVEGVSSEWTEFKIPLFDFLISDYSALDEMIIVFEDTTAQPKEGFIYIDDIQLTKDEDGEVEDETDSESASEAEQDKDEENVER